MQAEAELLVGLGSNANTHPVTVTLLAGQHLNLAAIAHPHLAAVLDHYHARFQPGPPDVALALIAA